MAKRWEKEEARRLRREEGLSLKEICERLGVSKSTASLWVRDIPLTPEQVEVLEERLIENYEGRRKGSETVKRNARILRVKYQKEGREKARELLWEHAAGCFLYWAEGRKGRNALEFTNSDPEMLLFYLYFIRNYLHIRDEDLTVVVNCYVDNGLSQEEIEDYWLNLLGLPRSQLGKTQINKKPKSSKQQGRKLLYGTCKLHTGNTRAVMHIFGAIYRY